MLGEAKRISLGDNLNVMLLTGETTAPNFNVQKLAEEKLDVRLSGNALSIEAKSRSMPDTIYLTVHSLELLSLGENTIVHVQGLVTTRQLTLFVDHNSKAYVRTIGTIKAHSMCDEDINVETLIPNGRTDIVVF